MGRPWWYDAYWKRQGKSPRGYKRPKSRYRWRKSFLVLLVIACLVAAGWTGYLLFTNQTDPIVGTIILVADVGVLIWNISALKKYRVGAGTVVSILLIVALLGGTASAFASVEPFTDAKDKVVEFFGGLSLGTSSELKTTIIGFEAPRQPPDISKVVFLVILDRTENTVRGAEYSVELLLDGEISDTVKVTVAESGSMEGSIYLESHGRVMNKMLSELDEKYEAAKSQYGEFEAKHLWDVITGHERVPSWEGLKELQKEEKRLYAEMNRWSAWRNGDSLGYYDEFDRFCRKYVKLVVARREVST